VLHDGLVVPDTNVLIALYEFDPSGKAELLRVLDAVRDRLWIPCQVAQEFDHRRGDVQMREGELQGEVRDLCRRCKNLRTGIDDSLADSGVEPTLLKRVDTAIGDLAAALDACAPTITDEDDDIAETLAALFDGRIGRRYRLDELTAVCGDARLRYDLKIPPGFEDAKAKRNMGHRRYGDYLLWRQTLDMASQQQRGILMLQNEVKADWWLKVGDERVAPREELIQEMREVADVAFHMVSADEFLEFARQYLGIDVAEATIEQARKVVPRPWLEWESPAEKAVKQLAASLTHQMPGGGLADARRWAEQLSGHGDLEAAVENLARSMSTAQAAYLLGGLSSYEEALERLQRGVLFPPPRTDSQSEADEDEPDPDE
jgi:rRNA-processing protein FCF1